MANNFNLKPFKAGEDSRRNTSGANGTSISKYLKDLGNSKKIKYCIEAIDETGKATVYQDEISAKGNRSINHVIAAQLLSKAARGDLKAIQEVLDRTEGKPMQAMEIDGLMQNHVIRVGFENEEEE